MGKYAYYGTNSQGYPRYVNQQSGAEISIGTYKTSDLVLKIDIPNYGTYYSDATSIANGVVIPAGGTRFEIVEDFWSPPGTSILASLTNPDQINIENDNRTLTPELQMVATHSDCQYYGFEDVASINTPGMCL